MHKKALEYLVCPQCAGPLAVQATSETATEVIEGNLKCMGIGCGKKYLIAHGMADLLLSKFDEEASTMESFGFEWGSHLQGKVEKQEVFGRSVQKDLEYFFEGLQISPDDIARKLILDAGCGSATLTTALTEFRPQFVFGTDIHSATLLARKRCEDLSVCEIVKADIFRLPFHDHTFDIVWCNGVLHHTPDTREAFIALARKVKLGGKMYVWVYERGFYPFRFLKDIFRLVRLDRLPHAALFRICQALSFASVFLHAIYRIALGAPILLLADKQGRLRRSLRFRSYEEFLMTWFDSLSPRFDFRHTRSEVSRWFEENGFGDLKYWNNQIGIVGRRVK